MKTFLRFKASFGLTDVDGVAPEYPPEKSVMTYSSPLYIRIILRQRELGSARCVFDTPEDAVEIRRRQIFQFHLGDYGHHELLKIARIPSARIV